MKSNLCKIEKGTKDLAAILRESEKVAVYNELDQKQTHTLRLLCEELDGMLPELVGDFDGGLVINFDGGVCRIEVSIEIPIFTTEKKDQLIGIAKNKKNAGASGLFGRVRSAVEDFFLSEDPNSPLNSSPSMFASSTGFSEFVDYSYYWSLDKYKASVNSDQSEAWDELEKSLLASLADDVIVGIKGRRADIIVIKKFN